MDQNQNGSIRNQSSNGVNSTRFPKNFFWGAATAAHQIEGGNVNDWSEWEKENAERLAKRSGDNPNDHISGRAANGYELYIEDTELIKELGLNAYRFSIEWSRIEPKKGEFDMEAIAHYQGLIKRLTEAGVEPFVTLWHWPIPLWLRDEGGLQSHQIIEYFSAFAQKVVENLKDVKFWITLNEASVYANKSYREGDWPPQKKSLISYLNVIRNLIKVHREAYDIIKKINPGAQIGIANHMSYIDAPWPFRNMIKWWVNEYFLNKIQDKQDFIGVNYYFHYKLFGKNANERVSDMGWELYPRGLYHVLKDLKKYHKPIYITEHGLADAKDVNRAWYIEESLKYIKKAIDEGADARGYLHWSLLDNFEWWDGFWPRFGLIEVQYDNNFKRIIRPSAKFYAELIKKARAS